VSDLEIVKVSIHERSAKNIRLRRVDMPLPPTARFSAREGMIQAKRRKGKLGQCSDGKLFWHGAK
jgi:hypothetical protein